jgi:5-methylcytosine-specific restriction endonuclease McrA
MAPNKSPAFQFYPDEFRFVMATKTLAQIGREFRRVCWAVANGNRAFDAAKPSYIGRIYWSRDGRPGIPKAIRAAVFAQAGHACVFCGSPDRLTIDHVVAWSKGGAHDMSNFQALCWPCNRRKGAQ